MAEAKINKEMMSWARKNAGYIGMYESQIPSSIKDKYKLWENGEKYPTWNQLREASKSYKVPTAVFFMKKPPIMEDLPDLINYRKLGETNEYNSPKLIANIRKSESRRSIYLDLLKEMEEEVPIFKKCDLPKDKYVFSEFIRKSLNVDSFNQRNWFEKGTSKDYKHYNFLNKWKDLLNEKFNILIFETESVTIEEMRGLCIFHDTIPIILLNGKDSVNGRIFSLFHELTHLLLGKSAICDYDESTKEEIFCNAVAGEFLVPSNDLIKNVGDIENLSADNLKKLTHLYGVSEYVILRRLLDIDKITKIEYDEKVESLNNFVPKSKGNGGNYLNNMVKYNGKHYYSLILEAYDSGIINTFEFIKFTNLSKKHIHNLEEKIYGE